MAYKISLIIGIILFVISVLILKETLVFLEKSERAVGTVTRFEEVSTDGITYTPIFKIKTKDNQEITYTHTSSANPPSWDIGEQATFFYDPNNLNSIRISTYFGVFSWSIVLMAIAIPLIIVGISYYVLNPYLHKLDK